MDLDKLAVVSEAVTRAALLRKESRGAQFREDFPEQGRGVGQVQHRGQAWRDGQMQVEKRPLAPMPDELKAVVEEMK